MNTELQMPLATLDHSSLTTADILPPSSFAVSSIQSDLYLVAAEVYKTVLQVLHWIRDTIESIRKNLDLWMQYGVSGHALPAMSRFSRTDMCYLKQNVNATIKGLDKSIKAEPINLRIDPTTNLSGIKITGSDPETQSKKWIVYFQPNAAVWEANLLHLIKLHEVTTANILSYNYPQVGFSTGEVRSQDDVLLAADKIMHSLLDQGVSDQDILMHGFSVGGLVASIEAAKLADEGFFPALCNERSTLSVPEMLHAHANFTYFISWIFVAYHWTLNAERALCQLKERTKVLFISNPYDSLMLPPAQAVRVKDRMQAEVACIQMERSAEDVNEHARPWQEDEYVQYNRHVRRMLQIAN